MGQSFKRSGRFEGFHSGPAGGYVRFGNRTKLNFLA
jgi:hypothetical protein